MVEKWNQHMEPETVGKAAVQSGSLQWPSCLWLVCLVFVLISSSISSDLLAPVCLTCQNTEYRPSLCMLDSKELTAYSCCEQ